MNPILTCAYFSDGLVQPTTNQEKAMQMANSGLPSSPSPDGEVPATFYRLDFGFEESPSVGQQMPEALRKRLENRKEQLVQQKKLQPEKGEKSQGEKNEKIQSEKAEKNEKLEKKFEKTERNDEKFLDDKASPSSKPRVSRARPGDEIPPLALETTRKHRSNSIGGLARRASREEGVAQGHHLMGAATARANREKPEKPGAFNVPSARSGKNVEKVEKGEGGVGTNSSAGGRQMFDKNTLRMMHREVFKGAIGRYQQRMLECHGSNDDFHRFDLIRNFHSFKLLNG